MSEKPTGNSREEFEAELDELRLGSADALVVLRNWDKDENDARIARASKLIGGGWAKLLIMVYEDNTKAEAERIAQTARELGWTSIILVTHRYHGYRAYLTFIKTLGKDVRIYIDTISSGLELSERQKIEQYSTIGDCATYSEGLEYIKWLRIQ